MAQPRCQPLTADHGVDDPKLVQESSLSSCTAAFAHSPKAYRCCFIFCGNLPFPSALFVCQLKWLPSPIWLRPRWTDALAQNIAETKTRLLAYKTLESSNFMNGVLIPRLHFDAKRPAFCSHDMASVRKNTVPTIPTTCLAKQTCPHQAWESNDARFERYLKVITEGSTVYKRLQRSQPPVASFGMPHMPMASENKVRCSFDMYPNGASSRGIQRNVHNRHWCFACWTAAPGGEDTEVSRLSNNTNETLDTLRQHSRYHSGFRL